MNPSKIINIQLDIKQGQLTNEELDAVFKKLKTEKLKASTKYPLKFGRQEYLTTYFSDYATQNKVEKWTKGCTLPFPKKGDLRMTKNYRGITLIAIAAKIYNAIPLHRIWLKIARKNQKSFRRNRTITVQRILR